MSIASVLMAFTASRSVSLKGIRDLLFVRGLDAWSCRGVEGYGIKKVHPPNRYASKHLRL
jgi:hypothetical protein